MTNKEFKEEVFARAEKQIAKRKMRLKTIGGISLSLAAILLVLPISIAVYVSSNKKGNAAMAPTDHFDYGNNAGINDEYNQPVESSEGGKTGGAAIKDDDINDNSGELVDLNELSVYDMTNGANYFISKDDAAFDALMGEMVSSLATDGRKSQTDIAREKAEGIYRFKVKYKGGIYYIGENQVRYGENYIISGNYINAILKFIEN